LKGCDVQGVFWGESVRRDPAGHRANMTDVLAWIAEGRLTPRIHATYPLADIATAIGVLDRREAVGKVVLTF
jgi:NADPH2:quinone reductase